MHIWVHNCYAVTTRAATRTLIGGGGGGRIFITVARSPEQIRQIYVHCFSLYLPFVSLVSVVSTNVGLAYLFRWSGNPDIHIIMFCPTSFFSHPIQIDQFEKKSVAQNKNIWIYTTDLNNTGSRIQWPEVKTKKMTYLEYQDGGRIVLQDVSASYEQYQKEIIATKA